jgi:GNAT superfamily N-acetyltransferase
VYIREATLDDWPAIYPFFTQIVDEGHTYAYPVGLSEDEAAAVWMEPPPSVTVVAVDGETVLGSAKMGPNRPARGSHIATASFMVDPAHQGRGVGRALGEWVVAWGREQGYHGMQFNAVVETNTAAVRLWKTLGFQILTTVPEAFDDPEHGYVGLHVMFQKF